MPGLFLNPASGIRERTREKLNAVLNRGDLFVAFLTTLPHLRINHAVLALRKKPGRSPDLDCYFSTIQIIQKDHENSPGPNPIVHSPTKRLGFRRRKPTCLPGLRRVAAVVTYPLSASC